MDFLIDIGGKDYTLASDDQYLGTLGRIFEPRSVELFRTIAGSPRTIFDVGANVGCTALLFADMAATVHAFEPSPSTFDFLRSNVDCATNVKPHNFGLGSKRQTNQITYNELNRSGGFVSKGTKTNDGHITESIQIDTIDRFVRKQSIRDVDFIKIDVEGYEAHVIQGAKRTLKRQQPVVTMELNHWCLNAYQRTSVPDFFDFMRSVFPVLYAIEGSTFLDLHDPKESYIAMYCHIVCGMHKSLVGAFHDSQLANLRGQFTHRDPREEI